MEKLEKMEKVTIVALEFVESEGSFIPVFYFSNGDSLEGRKAWELYKLGRLEAFYRARYMSEYPADISFTPEDFGGSSVGLHDTPKSVGRMI